MATLTITALDGHMTRFHNVLGALGAEKANKVFMRTLNAEGDKMRTKVVRAVTKQTGLKRPVIVRAVRRSGASPSNLEYRLTSRGGNVRLKFFRAREFRYGVKAYPRNKPTQFPGAFIKGGRFPSRVTLSFRGEVKERVGASRLPIRTKRSDIYIPDEMVTGESLSAYYAAPEAMIQQLDRQLGAIFRGF